MHFRYTELQFLGHVVSADGVRLNPGRTAVVARFLTTTDNKPAEHVLDPCVYYRRFIAGFSPIVQPLTRLARNNISFVQKTEQETTYFSHCQRHQTPTILRTSAKRLTPRFKPTPATLVLALSLSNTIGRLIAYARRTLSRVERNYSTSEKEWLAVA